ncbi:MAG TPA: GGDEF domain-containing protein [Pseudomonadales bacterium]|nr:GGDEF domain-containing protein [Pseudomonadales bacterium]
MRRALVAFGGCMAFVVLAWIARELGYVRLSSVAFWLVFGPWLAGQLGLVAIIASGRNLRLRDPALTLVQILWAGLGPVLLYPFVPEVAQVSHMGVLAIGLFGAFRLGNGRYLATNASLAAAMGAAFALQQFMWSDELDLRAALIGFVAFVVALLVITFAGFELGGVRRALTRRNDELTLAFDKLRDMAIRDELTGIHNRRFLMDVLHQQKALADRRDDHGFSLCFVDLDHFKRVNDVFGHAKGDLVLRRFAEIASKAVRDVDYVARLGGEEFVLVLVGSSQDNARIVAERIRRQMAALTVSDLIPDFRITASCGITEYAEGEDIEQAMSRADAALYEAKAGGRNRVVVADRDSGDGHDAEALRVRHAQQRGGAA